MNVFSLAWKTSLVIVFLGLNSVLNLLNRWVLGVYQFRFPLTLTVAHMAFCFVALAPVMAMQQFRSLHASTLRKQWKGLVGIGFFVAANVALNNVSLVYITLALNQVIRSGMPVATATLAVYVENKVPSTFEASSLVILTLGVAVTVCAGAIGGSVVGILFCFAALLSNAAMTTFSAKILSEKMDALRLTFYTSPVSFVTLAPFAFALEWQELRAFWDLHSTQVTYILVISSVVALAYNIVHYVVIQVTSSTTTTVLGMVKVIGIVVAGSWLLGEHRVFTVRFTLGAILAFIGFFMYTYTKLPAFRRSAVPQAEAGGFIVSADVESKEPLLKSGG